MKIMEYLFRGKDIETGKWLFGSHYDDGGEEYILPNYPGSAVDYEDYQVDPNTSGQFIGRNDGEGNRIYNGDIIAHGLEHPKLVAFREDCGGFCLANIMDLACEWLFPYHVPDAGWWRDYGSKFAVVGNKYDNPEMLDPEWWRRKRCGQSYPELKTLKCDINVRYWEDGMLNHERDDADVPRMPCAVKEGDEYRWKPVIDIRTGMIENWEKGIIADIHYKVCDGCGIEVIDVDGKSVKTYSGYVPDILCPSCQSDGDYIIMHIDTMGVIQDWKSDDYLLHEIMNG